jgi:hypothetical protein
MPRTLGRCIYSVDFAIDRDGRVRFCLCSRSNLVNVLAIVQAGDGNLADILWVISYDPLAVMLCFSDIYTYLDS